MTITDLRRPEPAVVWPERQVKKAEPEEGTRRRRRWWLRMWGNEIFLLTLVALAGYVFVAFWMSFDLHFFINDALTRSGDAVYVTVGRDPHLAAIGFYWPPLAQLIQLPFAPITTHYGYGNMSGPLSSAVCTALTIPVLARIGRFAGLRRLTIFLICVTFAINPVTIYYAGVGMSEACSVLFIAVALLGFLRYTKEDSIGSILIFSGGLCGVVMTRLEGPFVTVALVVVAVFGLNNIRRRLWNGVLIAGPPAIMFLFWMLLQWIIEGDPLFFRHQQGGGPPTPGHAAWLPNTAKDPFSAVPWALHWVLVFGPALALLVVMVVIRPPSWKTRGYIGILGAAMVFPVIQIDQVITGTGFGNPRYFMTAIVFATVGVMWIASSPPRGLSATVGWTMSMRAWRGSVLGLWNVGLIAVLLVSGGTGAYSLTSGKATHVENECEFFQFGVARVIPALGRSQHGTFGCYRRTDNLKAWRLADRYLDSHLKPTDRVVADNSVDFAADLFTTKPQLFVVENDRDWDKIIANPTEVTYVVTQSATARGKPEGGYSGTTLTDQGAAIISYTPNEWHLVATEPFSLNLSGKSTSVQVWHFVPSKPGNHPEGSESSLDN